MNPKRKKNLNGCNDFEKDNKIHSKELPYKQWN